MPLATCKHVGILGGGTAGYFTALALRRWFPDLRITLVESSKIPIIGVGEATTPPLISFLHNFLGIDIEALHRAVKPTWKLGIHFDWGSPGGFDYPFTTGAVTDAHAHDGHVGRASLGSLLMAVNRVPLFARGGEIVSGLKQMRFAYHLDNRRFVHFLRDCAAGAGVEHLDAVIADAVVRAGAEGAPEIDHLVTSDGGRLDFDFYVDCSGFRTVLLGKALGSPYLDYASSLFCNRAVVADVPHDGTVKVYTRAEAMDSGWCWNIPMVDCDHRGYVYSADAATPEQAIAEMRAKNPGMSEPWQVQFRSGRHHHFCRGNVAAVGNAYGFVEPLESTALHMAIIHVHLLVRLLDADRRGTEDHDRDRINATVGAHWDYLRWFLAIHYRFNKRFDTPFWQRCRAEVDITGLADTVADFSANGPLSGRGWKRPPDAIFGAGGLDVLLLGQDVPTVAGPPTVDRAGWERSCAARQALVAQALPYAEALPILEARPELLRALISDDDSWTAELADVLTG